MTEIINEIKLTPSEYDNKECLVEMVDYEGKKVRGVVLGHFEQVDNELGILNETFIIKLLDKVRLSNGRILKMCYRQLDEIQFI